jgi:hypothetical protein
MGACGTLMPLCIAFDSNGRVVVPSTGGNWEGTGVHPDLAVPQGNALQTAHVAALKRVLEIADVATPDLARVVREEVRQGLAELERREADLSPEAGQGEGTASPSCRLYAAFS